jgi:signal transduction histidine kinase
MSESDAAPPRTRVLVVDDEDANRMVLRVILERQGHEVHEECNGRDGVEAARRLRPDVILMDVMMPLMTGIEATRAIREDPGLAHIPLLLVTSLTDREYRLEGIGAGASDFLNKPIDAQDVTLRVRNAARMKALHDELRATVDELVRLQDLRDRLVHMLVHDLKAPLGAICGYLDNLEAFLGDRLAADERLCLDAARQGALNLGDMIHAMLDVNRLECGQLPLRRETVELGDVTRGALRDVGTFAHRAPVTVNARAAVEVSCDRDGIRRVLVNLLHNALKFTPGSGRISVTIEPHEGGARVCVKDTGPGIADEHKARVFDRYFQAATRQERIQFSTGLGLTFCKLMVEAHGGRIGVESEPGRGSEFWFTLPGRS